MSYLRFVRIRDALTMSRMLINWSFFYSIACLGGTALSLITQSRGPLVVAGMGAFGSLLYMYGAGDFTNRLFKGANLLTLSRLLLTLSLFATAFLPDPGWLILGISLIILIADGFDGWLARKRNEASEFGEYFDKETDAFFLLTLCLIAYWQDRVGLWIMLPGVLRYIFVIALKFIKPDTGKEYRSKWARIIYVVMISSLLGVFVLPSSIYGPAITISTAAIVLSFAHYFRWLLSQKLIIRSTNILIPGILAFSFLNTLLLLPTFITNAGTSTFLPVPDADSVMHWTRGWYDYALFLFVRRPNQDVFRICVELVALVALIQLVRRPSFIRRVATPLFIGLLVYETYDALAYSFFHRPGILFEDARYGINLFYLLRDALSIEQAPIFIGIVTATFALVWILPVAFKGIINVIDAYFSKKAIVLFYVLFWSASMFCWAWFGEGNLQPTLRSISGKMIVNVTESVQLHRVHKTRKSVPVDSVYESFANTPLQAKPDIYLIMIESYGTVLQQDTALKDLHTATMTRLESTLSRQGWLAATRESEAPVSGGLSWLSMSSTLAGMMIDNKSLYTSFLSYVDTYPHLVQYLNENGYTTITLQPPNRARPGLPLENYYRFDQTVFFDELDYKGTPYGVWIIPDQYSLERTFNSYIKKEEAPVFLFFETASTHAPWVPPPPLVADWRDLNTLASPPVSEEEPGRNPLSSLASQVRTSYNNRFKRKISDTYTSYYRAIKYDLDVLESFILNRANPNSMFIILGDHQPPVLKNNSFNTPLHIISKDSTLMQQLPGYGFSPGLLTQGRPSSSFTHAGVYSMLVDLLSQSEGTEPPLPSDRFRPQGIPSSFIP